MKFPYIVKKDGVTYPAGTEVPVGIFVSKETENDKHIGTKSYTKTEINRMPIDELKKLASECGIDDAKTGTEIKDCLIKHFGL